MFVSVNLWQNLFIINFNFIAGLEGVILSKAGNEIQKDYDLYLKKLKKTILFDGEVYSNSFFFLISFFFLKVVITKAFKLKILTGYFMQWDLKKKIPECYGDVKLRIKISRDQ